MYFSTLRPARRISHMIILRKSHKRILSDTLFHLVTEQRLEIFSTCKTHSSYKEHAPRVLGVWWLAPRINDESCFPAQATGHSHTATSVHGWETHTAPASGDSFVVNVLPLCFTMKIKRWEGTRERERWEESPGWKWGQGHVPGRVFMRENFWQSHVSLGWSKVWEMERGL